MVKFEKFNSFFVYAGGYFPIWSHRLSLSEAVKFKYFTVYSLLVAGLYMGLIIKDQFALLHRA